MRIVSPDPTVQSRFESMVASGESERLAEILALRKFPGVRTDSSFLSGHCNGNQFESCPVVGDSYQAVADEMGFSTTGKVYLSQLARFPGDPDAWVTGRGDVARVCRDRGYTCEGSVDYTPPTSREPIAAPSPKIDPAIVLREAARLVEREPDLTIGDAVDRITPLLSGEADLFPDHEIPVSSITNDDIGFDD